VILNFLNAIFIFIIVLVFFLNFVDIIETVDSTTVQEGKMILRNAAQYQQRWRHQY